MENIMYDEIDNSGRRTGTIIVIALLSALGAGALALIGIAAQVGQVVATGFEFVIPAP